MFQNVLVPVDLTDTHQRTLGLAADLTKAGGGTLTLLHVVEVVPGLSFDEEREFYERLAETAARTWPAWESSWTHARSPGVPRSSSGTGPRRWCGMRPRRRQTSSP